MWLGPQAGTEGNYVYSELNSPSNYKLMTLMVIGKQLALNDLLKRFV